MEFNRELREDVLVGDIRLSVRLWKRPRVREGGRYRVGLGEIEVDAVELVPLALVSEEDIQRSGERCERAAHAGAIGEDTLVYRIEFTLWVWTRGRAVVRSRRRGPVNLRFGQSPGLSIAPCTATGLAARCGS